VLDPGAIWVKADSPYKSVKDLIEAAKKTPNKISTVTTGVLSDDHLAILMVEEANPGAIFRIVHLEGGAQQLTQILGGHVEVAFDNVGTVVKPMRPDKYGARGDGHAAFQVPARRADHARARHANGYIEFDRGIAGPKGMPPAVVKRLQDGFAKAMADPEHVKKLEETGLAIRVMVGAEYEKYYRDLHTKAAKYTEWARKRPQK